MIKFPVDQLERFYQIQKYAGLVARFLEEFGPLDEDENLASLEKMQVIDLEEVKFDRRGVEFVERSKVRKPDFIVDEDTGSVEVL